MKDGGVLKYHLVWPSLLAAARVRGVDTGELGRVRAYLRHTFGVDAPSWVHPAQRPRRYFPGLTGAPVYAAETFPWVLDLEAAHAAVLEEFNELRAEALRPQPQGLAEQGRWTVFHLADDKGPVQKHLDMCPRTRSALSGFPGFGRAGHVYFSVVEPGTHVRAHCGPTNARIRCQLALASAADCRIRVDDRMLEWTTGRCLVFDDSFEHELWHRGSVPRAVLIADFWHPELTEAERWALGLVGVLIRTEFAGPWRKAVGMLAPGGARASAAGSRADSGA